MNEPIKSGDRCEVIAGALGNKGPNVGKQVTVGEVRGEHSEHGRIWRCYGEGLVTEFGAFGTQADFAQAWLRKLPPSAAPQAEPLATCRRLDTSSEVVDG
jgi:hypothetical protein